MYPAKHVRATPFYITQSLQHDNPVKSYNLFRVGNTTQRYLWNPKVLVMTKQDT